MASANKERFSNSLLQKTTATGNVLPDVTKSGRLSWIFQPDPPFGKICRILKTP